MALESEAAGEAVAAVSSGRAEAMLVVAGRGRDDIARSLGRRPELRLIDAGEWWTGPVRLRLPVLRRAILPAGSYPNQSRAVETLAMQTLLAGPAPSDAAGIGIMGPGTYADAPGPLPDATVRAINAVLGDPPDPGAHLPIARALRPEPRPAGEEGLAQPAEAVLSFLILAFLLWTGWLCARPMPEAPDPRRGSDHPPKV